MLCALLNCTLECWSGSVVLVWSQVQMLLEWSDTSSRNCELEFCFISSLRKYACTSISTKFCWHSVSWKFLHSRIKYTCDKPSSTGYYCVKKVLGWAPLQIRWLSSSRSEARRKKLIRGRWFLWNTIQSCRCKCFHMRIAINFCTLYPIFMCCYPHRMTLLSLIS